MLKQLLNECIIDLHITTDGPILIKSGIPTLSGPDMAFVKTWRNGTQEVYLPGSSLKGTLRSHAERIARTLNASAACDPFGKLDAAHPFCGNLFEARKDDDLKDRDQRDRVNQLVYHDSCPICRLFGSTWFAGRLATEDAYAMGNAPKPQQRDGVGIDRFTGGAAQGVKFDLEVVTEATFATRLHLRNFELWQLGLLGFVLNDFADGLIRIGAAKSRGLGRVRGEVKQVRVDFLGPQAPQPQDGQLTFRGLGALATAADVQAYGLAQPDEVTVPAPAANLTSMPGLRQTYVFDGGAFPWTALAPLWVTKATQYHVPDAMRAKRNGRPS
jgi:CRISPR-associated RAMP protein (TIGR02581 family)